VGVLLVFFLRVENFEMRARGEIRMSATVFLAICILGCDLLLYILYQWTYGERRRGLSRRGRARRRKAQPQNVKPSLAASRERLTEAKQNLRVIRGRVAERETGAYLGFDAERFGEERAYRRIAAGFAHAKR
jgi:hypothetical protein